MLQEDSRDWGLARARADVCCADALSQWCRASSVGRSVRVLVSVCLRCGSPRRRMRLGARWSCAVLLAGCRMCVCAHGCVTPRFPHPPAQGPYPWQRPNGHLDAAGRGRWHRRGCRAVAMVDRISSSSTCDKPHTHLNHRPGTISSALGQNVSRSSSPSFHGNCGTGGGGD